ncbi:hypothetical protein EV356DRAFT_504985 [Viridothelium virens]|uniref:DUF6699 domain-containing protein n=1 Tax=Viridothelium virens TaxID=1048519 RepID=A0A6A6H4F4_VIRVR|nr:hypothetical protein EV356DRAFT_504985 [Viridothelium virens]
MSADTVEPLSKVDSAVDSTEPASPSDAKARHRRTSSTVSGVYNINDLEKEGKELSIAPETQRLNWKLNTSPATLDEKDVLKKHLCEPPVKRIDLHFPLGLEVTARNLKGVTIKDALDAIYKQFKKKADDELGENPVLAGFEWDKEESWTRLVVHQKKEGQASSGGGKKSKKNKDEA